MKKRTRGRSKSVVRMPKAAVKRKGRMHAVAQLRAQRSGTE